MNKDNFLYAPVNLPNWPQIQAEMVAFRNKLGTPKEWFFQNVEHMGALSAMPTLHNWFKSQNMQMAECVYIITRARVITNIHKDIFAPNPLALNFPVEGCGAGVRTHFYKELIDVPFVQPGKNPHYDYKPHEIEQYDSTCVDQPTMLNVHVLHSVNNLTDQDRIVFSFRFRQAPWGLIGL